MTMRRVTGAVMAAMALSLVSATGVSARTDSCVDTYLLCINDASQEQGAFWRTLKEVECGAKYYGCVRTAITGA